ncbi:hypothetical protein [Promicromonospora iranensis]|uniref:NO-binding membrane sensor protein with MHYT domain n=1 Tax=Promicromonospora iranensis TaxID=1105144 RepID=A0ABU2CPS9_9MICO|nr:hypothetical protein [Promicromonospora iranensis]MDR7383354.1 hypothetical protein [Promicromonospora iranensis]
MHTLPDAGRRPAALSVLVLAVAGWTSVPIRLLIPGNELDLSFTMNNAIFVIEDAAMAGTVLLGVGAAALRARRVLIGAMAIVGVHLLLQLGTAGVQLANGARPELILGTLVAILVLGVVLAGVLLALLLRTPTTARRAGLVVALLGAVVHTLWTSVLLPVVAMLPYGGPPPRVVGSLLLAMAINLLVVAAAALCGWAASAARRVGALLAGVVGVLGIAAGAGAIGAVDGAYGAYGAGQIVQALLTLAAVPFAVIAGRRQAAARRAAY